MAGRVLVVVQGPLYADLNGYSTADALRALGASAVRGRLHVVAAVWEAEPEAAVDAIRPLVDEVVRCRAPERPGVGKRNMLREGVSQALAAAEGRGFTHVLKTRSDFLLPERFLARVVALADAGFDRVLVTDVFTRFEPFHVSDMLMFSTYGVLRDWFDPRPVYYEDAAATEVQLARTFVRNRGLPYALRLEDYLRFLRDWVELVDFAGEGVRWFKIPAMSRRLINRLNPMPHDRDGGPLIGRLVSPRLVRLLRRTRVPPGLVAGVILTLDPLARALVLGLSWFLERVLRLRPRYVAVPLPGGRELQLKLGIAGRRHSYYTVAPEGPEYLRPIEGGPGRGAPAPRDHGPVSDGIPGLFGARVRRRAARVGEE